jgi:hypothetical protein
VTDLSVVIPVRNDAVRLARCLASLGTPRDAAVELIVADNGSTDASSRVASQAGARVLSLPGHNVAWVRNTAARESAGPLVAFIDADHEVDGGWLTIARQSFDEADIGAVGAAYLPPEDGTWVQRMYGALRGRTIGRGPARWLGSGNMVVRLAAFDAIGGFDEGLEACEDVDFCQRLRAAGWRVLADERLRSTHHGDPPTLAALFRAERWRGRDNVKVSLRGGLSLRDVPSLAAPMLMLAAMLALVATPLLAYAFGLRGLWVAGAFVAAGLALPFLHAVRIAGRARAAGGLGQALAVALVYHSARALALVSPGGHHRR